MAERPTTDRSFANDVTLSIGFVSVLGDLKTIPVANVGKAEQLHSVCPTCTEPHTFLGTGYVCKDDPTHGPFAKNEIRMGKEIGDKIVIVDANAITEARTSILPKNTLDLQVHKRDEVAAKTFPMGNAYVFIPKGGKQDFYFFLVEILKKRKDIVFLAKTNMTRSDHFIQIGIELNDQLVVRDLVWPEDMKQFPEIQNPVKLSAADQKKLADTANTLIDVSIEPFDPQEYRKDSRERMATAIEEAATADGTPAPKKVAKAKSKSAADDLQAQIEAAIKAKKAS